MGRRTKNGKYLNVNIDIKAFEALERHCRESGQTKTVAVERAVLSCYGKAKPVLRKGPVREGGVQDGG